MNSKKKNNTKVYLYNTLTRSKTEFVPLNPDNIGIYVCGPTVYDYAHIGNARPVIVFDVLVRLFRHLYGDKKVTYVRNITDVDDKIIDAHQRTGESISELTSRTIRAFQNDMSELGNKAPDIEPRATDHIVEMQEMISLLIRKGNAYVKDGHVLFDVSTNSTYGKLSHRNLDELIAGARVEVAPYKKNPSDFVLWKPSDANQPGWSSPWDQENHPGRPGWHIECSAMSQKYLGDTFDIHAGGVDIGDVDAKAEKMQVPIGTDPNDEQLFNMLIKTIQNINNLDTAINNLSSYIYEKYNWKIIATKYDQTFESLFN